MKSTPLNPWHKSHGGTLVEFSGWEMPVVYTTITEEHKAVRERAGLFDICHMGQVFVAGARSLEFLQAVTTNDVSRLKPGAMQYSTLPAPDGTLLDDIIVTRLGWQGMPPFTTDEPAYLVVVNAGNAGTDFAWLRTQAERFEVEVVFAPEGMLALQGPASQAILSKLTGSDLEKLPYYHLTLAEVAGVKTLLSRSGYTGEDGFEICLPAASTAAVWEAILQAGQASGIVPVGLGARNTLRMEMGYALYGHEIDRTTNPLEAGLGWVVKLDKGSFVGRQALVAAQGSGLARKLAGFEMLERAVARDGYSVVDASGQVIGKVTSGGPSPTLGKNIGMAYVPAALAAVGSEILIQVRDRTARARVVPRPFVPSHVRKNKVSS
jgi:aminomethyltransferase